MPAGDTRAGALGAATPGSLPRPRLRDWTAVARSRRSRLALGIGVLALAGVTFRLGVAVGTRGGERPLGAAITLGAPGGRVPRSFVGVSIDSPEVPDFRRASAAFGRAMALIRARDSSPTRLRVGGKYADSTYWRYRGRHDPVWIFHAGPSWLREVAALTRVHGFTAELVLNLAAHAPRMAVSFARAARHALPPGALSGLSVGNEPDVYHRHPRLERERVPSRLRSTPRHWTRGYTMRRYRRDFLAYARALRAARLGLPLAGPETAHVPWRGALDPLGRSGPGTVTFHRYALTACPGPRTPLYPTIGRLLNRASSTGLADGLPAIARGAHAARRTLRLSEFDANSCPGPLRVSDSFATALWAPDALFELATAGVDGVNFELRSAQRNSPLAVSGTTLTARPTLYGIALFARMIGPRARLVHLQRATAQGLHLKSWAVSSSLGLRVLLVNKGSRAASVRVRNPGATARVAARVERLTAPGISATAGVRLAGRSISPSGRLAGRPVVTTVTRSRGAYRVLVPGYSAALVTLPR